MSPDANKISKELKQLLSVHFPGLLDKLVLYGSRSKGFEKEDSDYDFLVILKNQYDWQTRKAILSDCYEIDLKYGILTDVKVVSQAELNGLRGQLPFIMEALATGVYI